MFVTDILPQFQPPPPWHCWDNGTNPSDNMSKSIRHKKKVKKEFNTDNIVQIHIIELDTVQLSVQ